MAAAAPLRRDPSQHSPLEAEAQRPRCATRRAIPGAPRTRPRKHRADSQCAAIGHPCPVPLRGVGTSRSGRRHCPRPRDSTQARPAWAGDFSIRRRSRRPARRARPRHVGRSPRPHPARARDPDRAARLGAHWAALCGSEPRAGSARQLPGERPQAADHAAHQDGLVSRICG